MQSTILPSADNAGPPVPETTTGDKPTAAAPSVKSRRVIIIALPLVWFGNYPASSPMATRGVGLWHEAANLKSSFNVRSWARSGLYMLNLSSSGCDRVESRMSAVAWGLWPTLRFPSPLIEPDVPD